MTLRRAAFWANVGLNGVAAGINFALVSVDLGHGRSPWVSIACATMNGAFAYWTIVSDGLTTARLAIYTAQQRTAEAQTALHEDLLAKVKRAHVDVSIVQGDSPAEGVRH